MTGLLIGLLFIGIVGVLALWRGFALTYLWQWFLVPFGLPAISLFHAIGLSLTVAFLTYQYKGTDNDKTGESLVYSFLMPALALGFDYIWQSFM